MTNDRDIVIEREGIVDLDEQQRGSNPPRNGRRLVDKLVTCVHQACDMGDYEVAEQVLQVLELTVTRRAQPNSFDRRRNIESLVAGHERGWLLRNKLVAAY